MQRVLQTIVVPLDGSESSTRAVPAAFSIGRASGASVTLLGVATDDEELSWMRDRVHEASQLMPDGVDVDEDVVVDPDPAAVLLQKADDPWTVLCVASHDHRAAAAIRHSVGTAVIERAVHPLLVVGADADTTPTGDDVVVAIDGQQDPDALLWTGARWAIALAAALRIVTVFEPVLPDIRRPAHYSRTHGPSSDPGAYLEGIARRLDGFALRQVDLVPIPDPVSVATGLAEHLAGSPASVLVVGGRPGGIHLWPDVVREVLRKVSVPLLVVPSPAKVHTWMDDADRAGIDVGSEPGEEVTGDAFSRAGVS